MNPNLKNRAEPIKARPAKFGPPVTEPSNLSPLGRRLMAIVAEIDASDDPPMSEADLEWELHLRRCGIGCSCGEAFNEAGKPFEKSSSG